MQAFSGVRRLGSLPSQLTIGWDKEYNLMHCLAHGPVV